MHDYILCSGQPRYCEFVKFTKGSLRYSQFHMGKDSCLLEKLWVTEPSLSIPDNFSIARLFLIWNINVQYYFWDKCIVYAYKYIFSRTTIVKHSHNWLKCSKKAEFSELPLRWYIVFCVSPKIFDSFLVSELWRQNDRKYTGHCRSVIHKKYTKQMGPFTWLRAELSNCFTRIVMTVDPHLVWLKNVFKTFNYCIEKNWICRIVWRFL